MGKLTTTKIKGIKPSSKQQIIYDGDYLYLFVSPKGKKVFRLKGYRFNGKEINPITFGEFNDGKKGHVTLAEAREKARQAIVDYKSGIDHGQKLKAEKIKAAHEQANTLDDWFTHWIETKSDRDPKTQQTYRGRYAKWIAPFYGRRPIASITDDEVERLYQHIQTTCSSEMAKRCHIILNGIYKLARKKRVVESNPADAARDEIKPPKESHFPAIVDDEAIGDLLVTMENYGKISTLFAFRLIPYLMLRPINLVSLTWGDVDFDRALISIDAARMKTNHDHVIPYPRQVGAILEELHAYSGHGEYLLPNRQGKHHMNRDALSKGLRVMGYQNKHTPHGYRSMATTWLYNNHFYSYAIEKQLSHTEPNKVVKSYSRDDAMRYLDDRRKMLQAWADHLDTLRAKAQLERKPPQ